MYTAKEYARVPKCSRWHEQMTRDLEINTKETAAWASGDQAQMALAWRRQVELHVWTTAVVRKAQHRDRDD